MPSLSRRGLINGTLGAVAAGSMANAATSGSTADRPRSPREVWIASMGQMGLSAKDPTEMCRKMLARMEETAALKPDIICTPEVFPVVGLPGEVRPPLKDIAEQRSGPILTMFGDFARRHHCYVICSTYTKENGRFYNAAVLLDREGNYVGEFRKINPTDGEVEKGITPGPLDPPVFKTDFGTIAMQICYDVNWYDNWSRLAAKSADMVFWPSAFGGGTMLNSLAWMNKYYVVTSTRFDHPTKIVDPLGNDVVFTGRAGSWICAPVNFDYAVVQTVKYFKAFEDIRKKYGRAFQFRILHVEALALVEGTSSDISVAQVLKEFGIPTSREMIDISTRIQNKARPA
jgi:beta-ureidopropionase